MTDRPDADAATGRRLRGLLPILLLVTLTYPVIDLHPAVGALYAVLYVGVLTVGTRVASVDPVRRRSAVVVAGLVTVAAAGWAVTRDPWAAVAVLVVLAAFHALMILAVGEYLLDAPEVDRDVLLAGTSLYVLTGLLFVPATLAVELVTRELTGAGAYTAEASVGWQQMMYFSFTTLTTLGYGDVRPTTSPAQALAIAEAILGVLIVALIIGRLVGAVTGRRRAP